MKVYFFASSRTGIHRFSVIMQCVFVYKIKAKLVIPVRLLSSSIGFDAVALFDQVSKPDVEEVV